MAKGEAAIVVDTKQESQAEVLKLTAANAELGAKVEAHERRIKTLTDMLVYIKENIVHGSEKHINRINTVL